MPNSAHHHEVVRELHPTTYGAEVRRAPSLQSVVEHLTSVVFGIDEGGHWVLLNGAWETLLGWSVSNSLGKPFCEHVHADDKAAMERDFSLMAHHKKDLLTGRVRFLSASGKHRWLGFSAHATHNAEGVFTGAVGTLEDLADILVAEEALKLAKEQAEAANQAKSQFLASMSHEMRTPMHAIIGLTDMVLSSQITNEQTKQLKMVKASAGSLLEIIDEVLLHAKLESGGVQLEKEKFDLREVLGQALAPLLFRAMENHLELNWRVGAELPSGVIGDPHRLKHVLHHLVGNAIKFTHEGSVTVDVSLPSHAEVLPDESAGRGVLLEFAIKDTGIGISEQQRQNLFEAFSQGDGAHDRRYGGTGIGLAVSSRLVELMKGRVWLDSEPSKGSCFHFTAWFGLPELPVSKPVEGLSGSAPIRACSILVAEDNTVNQHLIRHLVTKMGHRPTIVANGRLCVEAWEKGGYDAILMDIQMPEMSGIEATIVIREREKVRGGHIPIIAVTANAVLGDRETCLKSGMDEYITKPIRNQLLEAALQRFLSEPEPAPVEASAPPQTCLMDYKVALDGADNDTDLLRSLMEMFLIRTPECLGKLERAFAGNDASEVMMQAHSLKGALRMLSTPEVEAIAFKIEKAGRQKVIDDARSAYVELKPKITRLYEEITGHLKELQVSL